MNKKTDKRIERLDEISKELHDIANSFAGDVTGVAAAELHGASGKIMNARRMLIEGITPEDERKMLAEWIMGRPELLRMLIDEQSS